MKHITPFKLFESNSESSEEIEKYLNDIFRELEDIGFEIRIETYADYGKVNTYRIIVRITYTKMVDSGYPFRQKFKFDLVKDYIESATDYMESIGWNMESQKEWSRKLLRWTNIGQITTGRDPSIIDEELKITYIQKNDRNSV